MTANDTRGTTSTSPDSARNAVRPAVNAADGLRDPETTQGDTAAVSAVTRHLTTPEVAEALMGRPCHICDGSGRCWSNDSDDPSRAVEHDPCPFCDGCGSFGCDWLIVDGPTPCTLHEACGCGRMGEGLPHCKLSCEWKIVTDAHRAVRAIETGERIDIVTRTACPCPECGRATAEDYNPDVWHGCDYCEDDPCIGFAECVEIVVGSVQPVEVLPIVDSMPDFEHSPWHVIHVFNPWIVQCYWPGHGSVKTVRNLNADLSVYGDPTELVGKYAVRVTDPRRAT